MRNVPTHSVECAPSMIELAGASAVSDFRIAKLRPALEAIHAPIGTVSARFIHFVDHWNSAELRVLASERWRIAAPTIA